jgi:photosystem II stability/assembly factor-like uncharacterized protein/N-acetylneuraminic acid mutarotase
MKQAIVLAVTLVLSSDMFAQPGQWLTRAPMPTPRQETTPAVLNGKIYLPGGFNSSAQAVTTVEAYDPVTNTWSTPPPLPEILHHYGLATVGGRMYLLGGYTGNSFTPTNRAYVFIPDSNLWRRIANMPVARGAHSAVEFNGRIYLFGGITNLGDSRRTDVYDPATDTYANLAQMPTAREHLAAARIDSLIYIVGGRIGATNNNVLEAYSPATNIWYTKAPMPTARGGLAAAAMRGRLYVCGGEIPGVFPQNEEYNPATNAWRTMRPMLTPRHGTGAVAVGDSVYVIGGATLQGFGVSGVNELFTLVEPRISLAPRSIDFGTLAISQCKNDSVKVKNVGNATLLISSIQSTNPRFSPNPTSAAISAGESLWVRVRFCADFPFGLQTGNLLFTHNGSPSVDTVALRATAFFNEPFWQVQNSGTTALLYSVRAVNHDAGWTGGSAGAIRRTINAGSNWVSGGTVGVADIYAVEALTADTAFVTTSPGGTFIHRTTNGGVSWAQVFNEPNAAAFINAILMWNQSVGIAIGDPVAGRWMIVRTTNGGASWSRTATEPIPSPSEFGWNNGAAKFGVEHAWFTTTLSRIYRTTNGGESWNSFTTPFPFRSVWFNSTTLGIGVGVTGAARSTDGGESWVHVSIPGFGFEAVSGYGNCFFVAGAGNVYFSSNRGVTWLLSFMGTSSLTHINLTAAILGRVSGWAVGGNGFIVRRIPFIDTDVDGEDATPNSFVLRQNYPNPFNPTTAIEYYLPRGGTRHAVSLHVFDLLGREVATLVNEEQESGDHRVEFNAEGLPSGIYFYRIQAGQFLSTRRMLLLR